jgi:hypothetical protein
LFAAGLFFASKVTGLVTWTLIQATNKGSQPVLSEKVARHLYTLESGDVALESGDVVAMQGARFEHSTGVLLTILRLFSSWQTILRLTVREVDGVLKPLFAAGLFFAPKLKGLVTCTLWRAGM